MSRNLYPQAQFVKPLVETRAIEYMPGLREDPGVEVDVSRLNQRSTRPAKRLSLWRTLWRVVKRERV